MTVDNCFRPCTIFAANQPRFSCANTSILYILDPCSQNCLTTTYSPIPSQLICTKLHLPPEYTLAPHFTNLSMLISLFPQMLTKSHDLFRSSRHSTLLYILDSFAIRLQSSRSPPYTSAASPPCVPTQNHRVTGVMIIRPTKVKWV